MSRILFRHLFIELFKVLALTTAIIVVVVAFGAVIKPLTQNLLGPGGVLKYIFLAMIPMLQYALPFSAGFAATIVTHRFASDNEIQAMSVSGISYWKILLPHAVLGLLLTVFMFLLVQTAIPRFWGLMSDVIADDAAQVFVSTVRSGEPFKAGDFLIYADRIALDEAPAPGVQQRIRLEGVAAIELDKSGKLQTEFVARSGSADLYADGDDLFVKVAFREATVLRPGDSTVAFMPSAEPMPTIIDREWERSPKYLPWGELVATVRDPTTGAVVQMEKHELEQKIAPALAIDRLGRQLEATGEGLLASTQAGRDYVVRGAVVGGRGLIPKAPAKRITVVEREGSVDIREVTATSAILSLTSSGQLASSTDHLDLTVIDPVARNLRGAQDRIVHWPARIVGLTVAPNGGVSTSLFDAARHIAAQTQPPLSAYASAAKRSLEAIDRKTSDTRYEALSHMWMRFAQPASVALVLLLGAVLAIWRRSSLPLTIYLLAFLPGIANVLVISSGQSMIRGYQLELGAAFMWSGNLVLVILILLIGRRMARN